MMNKPTGIPPTMLEGTMWHVSDNELVEATLVMLGLPPPSIALPSPPPGKTMNIAKGIQKAGFYILFCSFQGHPLAKDNGYTLTGLPCDKFTRLEAENWAHHMATKLMGLTANPSHRFFPD